MKKTVETNLRTLSGMTLCNLMDTCLPAEIEDERDMLDLIRALWPKLIAHQQCDQIAVADFLDKNAPNYEDWRNIDESYCCEITLLKERERLMLAAKEVNDDGK